MSTLHTQIETIINNASTEIAKVIAKSALGSLDLRVPRPARVRTAAVRKPRVVAAAKKPVKRPGKGGGCKRSPQDLAALVARVESAIDREGVSMEQLRAKLGLGKAELLTPIRSLLKDGRVTKSGTTRSMVYTLAS